MRIFGRSSDPDPSPVGRDARVIGTVGPGLVGEVIIAIRGGSESYTAYPFIGTETFQAGALVRVVEYTEPRVVYVVAAN